MRDSSRRCITSDRGEKSNSELSNAIDDQRQVSISLKKLQILVAEERKGREATQKADGDEQPDGLSECAALGESHDKAKEQGSEDIRGKGSPRQRAIVNTAEPLKQAIAGNRPDTPAQRNLKK